jgi:hypothetical protein
LGAGDNCGPELLRAGLGDGSPSCLGGRRPRVCRDGTPPGRRRAAAGPPPGRRRAAAGPPVSYQAPLRVVLAARGAPQRPRISWTVTPPARPGRATPTCRRSWRAAPGLQEPGPRVRIAQGLRPRRASPPRRRRARMGGAATICSSNEWGALCRPVSTRLLDATAPALVDSRPYIKRWNGLWSSVKRSPWQFLLFSSESSRSSVVADSHHRLHSAGRPATGRALGGRPSFVWSFLESRPLFRH